MSDQPRNRAVAWMGERRKLIPAVLGMVLSWAVLVGWVDPISMEIEPDFVLTWQAAAGGLIQMLLGVVGVERIGNRTSTINPESNLMKAFILGLAFALGLSGCATLGGVDGRRDFTDDLVILAAGTEFLTEGMIAVIETGDMSADEAGLLITAGNTAFSVLNAAHYAVNAYRGGEVNLSAVLNRLIDVAVSLPDLYRLSQIDDNPIDGIGGWLTVVAKVGSSSWPTVLEVRREIQAAAAAGLPELPEAYVQSVIDNVAEANAWLNARATPFIQ